VALLRKRSVAFLVLGFFLGAVSIFILSGQQLEDLYQERERLKVDLFETRERLNRLEDLWESRHEEIVREIKIDLEMEKDTFGELSIKKAIQEIVNDLVGERVQSLNPTLVIRMLDGRKITADGREYRLDLQAVVISETLTLYIKPERISSTPQDEP
jgi:hypothetical protein